LRLDASPFPANAGYRLYAMHERIDPLASRSREIHASGPLPPELAYLPYEGLSAVLAGLADTELARGGLSPAPEKIGVAPLYLLKRADLPSALVTLGYRTNDKERARMADTGFVESAARSLAQALLEFDRQLRSVTETN
jgi:N-acetylmuramoyl-L-alanine amidase